MEYSTGDQKVEPENFLYVYIAGSFILLMLFCAIIYKIMQCKDQDALIKQQPETDLEMDKRAFERFKSIEKEAMRRQAVMQNQQP